MYINTENEKFFQSQAFGACWLEQPTPKVGTKSAHSLMDKQLAGRHGRGTDRCRNNPMPWPAAYYIIADPKSVVYFQGSPVDAAAAMFRSQSGRSVCLRLIPSEGVPRLAIAWKSNAINARFQVADPFSILTQEAVCGLDEGSGGEWGAITLGVGT